MKPRRGDLFAQDDCTAAERDYICQGAAELGVSMTQDGLDRLSWFLRALSIWNRRFRMVGTEDRQTFLRAHVLDALAPAPTLKACSSVVDIGSGAGLPGVPLSIACPGLTVTLVESRRVRANFLRDVVRRLDLRSTLVVEARIEWWARERRADGLVGATIARAWRGLPAFLSVSAGLVRPGGIAVAMIGPGQEADSREVSGAMRQYFEGPRLIPYRLSGGQEHRSLAVFRHR